MCRTIWRAKKQAPIPTNIVTPRTPLPDPKCLKSKTFSAPLLLLHRPPIPVSPSIGRRSIAAPIRCQNWRPTKGERPSRDHPWQQDRHRYRARVRRLVLTKKKPSRFFGTPLLPVWSGVRSTRWSSPAARSAISCARPCSTRFPQKFCNIAPSATVFDRMPISQEVNQFDMNRCSADDVETSNVVPYLTGLAS